MRKRPVSAGIAMACAVWVALASTAFSEPVVGVDVGATLPLSKYRKHVNAGGSVGLWGGYGLHLNDWLWTGFILDPQFSFFAADRSFTKKTTTLFSLTAGPRVTVTGGNLEGFLNAQGGLYTDVSGPFEDTDGGWNVGGGFNYYLVPSVTTLGLFLRYDRTGQSPAPGSDADRQFVGIGLTVQHRFLEPEPAVAPAPPQPAAVVAAPAARQRLVLRGVRFDFDEANLREDARPVLDEAIRSLSADAAVDVSVDGYTDNVGSEAYNLRLSDRRARSVADYLGDGGIAPARLQVKGKGEADPVASNSTADGRAQNRRVELDVVGD